MSETEPISFCPAGGGSGAAGTATVGSGRMPFISFNRRELDQIFSVYGHMVAEGEWRDYAIDMLKDRAVFSVFRRSAERPLYRIEKRPKLERRQGAYSVIAMTGLIVKRGPDLKKVLRALDRKLQVVRN